jgi:hypothetical protein
MLVRNKVGLLFLLLTIVGCGASMMDYIRADHPYVRKVNGDYDKILNVVKDVLLEQGFIIQREVNPSDYERREGGEQSQDVLLFTRVRNHSMLFYSSHTHLNVFIRMIAEGAEIDIRYEKFTSGLIRHSSLRNDQLIYRILDKIEQSIESK